MRIAIVEDDPRLLASLRAVFDHEPDFSVEATFTDAEGVVAAAEAAPDWKLVLMDIVLPGIDGIEATRRIKRCLPEVAVVMLTVYEDPPMVLEAICAGADGYLLKKSTSAALVDEVRHIGRGGAPLTPRVAKSLLSMVRAIAPKRHAGAEELVLSPRERAVLRGLVDGRSYKQVAAELDISIDTVRGHIRRLYRKLQVHSVAEAVTRAIREHIV